VSPEIALQLAGLLGTSLVAVLAWSMRRNVQSVDEKVGRIETDVRQLSAQGARHGESLAAGVATFKSIEKRLDALEAEQKTLSRECFACRLGRPA
jgi:hypothetical protein